MAIEYVLSVPLLSGASGFSINPSGISIVGHLPDWTGSLIHALLSPTDKHPAMSLYYGGMTVQAGVSGQFQTVRANYGKRTGKWFFEVTLNDIDVEGVLNYIGVQDGSSAVNELIGISGSLGYSYGQDTDTGIHYAVGAATSTGPTTPLVEGGTYAFAVDMDSKKLWVRYPDGTWANSGDPEHGLNPSMTWTSDTTLFPACTIYRAAGAPVVTNDFNFGQSTFTSEAPRGFNKGWYEHLGPEYASLNPEDKSGEVFLSNDNLTAVGSSSPLQQLVRASQGKTVGKWYWEVTVAGISDGCIIFVGVQDGTLSPNNNLVGQSGLGYAWGYDINDAATSVVGDLTHANIGLPVPNGTIGFAVDLDVKKLWIRNVDGTWLNSGNPETGVNPMFTWAGNTPLFPAASFSLNYDATSVTFNFGGSSAFAHLPLLYGYNQGWYEQLYGSARLDAAGILSANPYLARRMLSSILQAQSGLKVSSYKAQFASTKLALTGSLKSSTIVRKAVVLRLAGAGQLLASPHISKFVTTVNFTGAGALTVDSRKSQDYLSSLFAIAGSLKVDARRVLALNVLLAPAAGLKVATRGKWYGSALLAATPSLRVATRGKWYGSARLAGALTVRPVSTKGPWAVSALFDVSSSIAAYGSRVGIDLVARFHGAGGLTASARWVANIQAKLRPAVGMRARLSGPWYISVTFNARTYWWPFIASQHIVESLVRLSSTLRAKADVALILSRAAHNDVQMHAASSLSCEAEALYLFTDPLNLGIVPNAGELVLYRAATGLEKAMADVDAYRITATYAELIRDQWDPFAISEQNLPYLGWAMGANLWESIWSTSTKREWAANQFKFKALRGTPEAFRMALKPSGYEVTDMVRPPQGFWASPDMTSEEWNTWIRQMPELRIFYAKREGSRGLDEFFCDYDDAVTPEISLSVPVEGTTAPETSDYPLAVASISLGGSAEVQGRTERVHIPPALLPYHRGVRLRLSLTAVAGTVNATVQKVFVGHATDIGKFDGHQVQLTFGGQSTVEFAEAGTATSDFVHFDYDPTRALILSFYSHGIGTLNVVSDHVPLGLVQWIDGIDVSGDTDVVQAWSEAPDRLDFITWFELEHIPFLPEGLWYWQAVSRRWQASPVPWTVTSLPISMLYQPPTRSDVIRISANTGYADADAPSLNDGFVLRGRYAVLRHLGVDTPLHSIEYYPETTVVGVFDYERFSSSGLMSLGFGSDEDAADDVRYVDHEETIPKIYTLQLNQMYDQDTSRLGLTMLTSDLTPIIPRYEQDSDIGDGRMWQFSETYAADYSFADNEDGGGKLLADRIYLLDPDVVEPMMQGISFADVSRVGIPSYYAELQIDLHGIEKSPAIISEGYFVEYEFFTVPEDTERIDRAFRAVLEAKALRDTIAVSFAPVRLAELGDYLKPTHTYGDWIRELL